MLIVTARNLSELAPISDYEVEVRVNNMAPIWRGIVRGHNRPDGAAVLLRRVAEAMENDDA